ncbi:uncharacterized protein LOC129574586 [Sitodiplosis mosellana]|uniref:uncharacterized protein LOC129574586 n=1 Tax=Sitodiplosis mosellana TaxID=263140 RepID=UPI00244451A9|nr:uncharacterized protein LOC129574586 [Sitodiplosis mosellana]
MTTTKVDSIFGSNDIGEYLRAKFVDEFFFSLDAWPNSTELNSNGTNEARNDAGDVDNNNNSTNIDGNRTHHTTNNGQTVDECATEIRKLANSDLCLPRNVAVAAIKQHDKFTANKQQQQQHKGQKKWSSKLPTAKLFCVFCKNNGEQEHVYTSHKVKDNRNRVCCPRLREYKCRICGASGDSAHTIRYCPARETILQSAYEMLSINEASSLQAAIRNKPSIIQLN